MFTVPRFKPCYHVVPIDDRTIGVISITGLELVEGGIYVALVKMIDGRTPTHQITRHLSANFGEGEIYFALLSLADLGFLEETDGLSRREAAFWGLMPVPTDIPAGPRADTTVGVMGLGCHLPPGLPQHLTDNGIGRVIEMDGTLQPHSGCDLAVIVVEDYLEPGLDEVNQTCLTHGLPWVLFKPVGVQPWIGPLFIPQKTGCWSCLASRIRANRYEEAFVLAKSGASGPLRLDTGALKASIQVAVHLLVLHLVSAVAAPERSPLAGQILSMDFRMSHSRFHRLIQRPQCARCGQAAFNTTGLNRDAEPVALKSRWKQYRTDGGHRTIPPETCFDRYGHHISPITGVVHYVEPCRHKTQGSPSAAIPSAFLAAFSPPATIPGVSPRKQPLIEFSAGKGATMMQARTSALCEALERYCWSFQGYEPRLRAPYHEVSRQAVHPNNLMLISQRQYRQRGHWQKSGARDFIPIPFDPNQPMDWSPVWSATYKEHKLLPTAYLYSNYNICPAEAFCRPDSNGNASGTCLEEAVLAGLMEVIERDAVAIWWYNRIQRPMVDLSTQMADPHVAHIITSYQTIGRKVWVLDVTCDTGIPVFVAVSTRVESHREDPILGFGAHLDPKIALVRALTEMNQLNQTLGSMERIRSFSHEHYPYDNERGRFQEQIIQFMTRTKTGDTPYLLPADDHPPVQLDDYPDPSTDDLRDDIDFCINLLRNKGLEVLILDQTRPDVGIRVVKVIIPGMRMLWRRFAPGRLYDVPVEMKWLDRPTPERDLNPIRPPV